MDNKTAIKINNLLVVHWLNILCKRGGVKRCVIAISAMLTSPIVAYMYFHIPELIKPENWPANSQYLNPVDFSVWTALQQKLYR